MHLLKRYAGLTLCCLLMASQSVAHATDKPFPSRAISILVGWSAGGATDLLARQVGEAMHKIGGQSIIVENKPGANGTIGHSQAARARADGYTTLLATNSTFAIAPQLYPTLPFDQEKDLAPVALLAESPLVLVASPKSGIESLPALLDQAGKKAGQLNIASGGNGSTSHMAAEMLMALTNTEFTHIPYKGGSPATVAVSASEVDLAFLDLGVALPILREGRAKALGVSSKQRSPLLADVPTLDEAGITDFEATTTFALFVPIDTPDSTIQALYSILDKAMHQPELLSKLDNQGVVPRLENPEGLKNYLQLEQQRWKEIIATRHISLD